MKDRPLTRLGGRLALASLLAVATAACGGSGGSGPVATTRVVKVVAGANFWGDLARQIGGAHASVASLVSDPVADPHQFESDAHDAGLVADAHVVIRNGLGYDDFVSKLLSVTRKRGRLVVTVADVLHAGDGANPHLWYDVPRVPAVAHAIERALATVDPADTAVFAANRAAFVAALAPVDRRLADIRRRFAPAPVAYTERVPEYLLDAAGLTVVSPAGFARSIEDGTEPSPADTHAMDELLSGRRARVLLYNAQATSPVTEEVRARAERAGVPVVGITETMPRAEPSYQSWMLQQVDALGRALEAGA